MPGIMFLSRKKESVTVLKEGFLEILSPKNSIHLMAPTSTGMFAFDNFK